ncbi:hypothetical protein KKF25_00810, partial [Patescibacteria group bacterium]|nr:hypothetical protein [Patescibacteria group bacterium]
MSEMRHREPQQGRGPLRSREGEASNPALLLPSTRLAEALRRSAGGIATAELSSALPTASQRQAFG